MDNIVVKFEMDEYFFDDKSYMLDINKNSGEDKQQSINKDANKVENSTKVTACKNNNICKYCDKTFLCMSKLEIHKRVHTLEKPYKCSVCDKSFNIKGNLKRHILSHNGKKPYKLQLMVF